MLPPAGLQHFALSSMLGRNEVVPDVLAGDTGSHAAQAGLGQRCTFRAQSHIVRGPRDLSGRPLGHISPWGKVATFGRAADCPQLGCLSCGAGSLLHQDSRVCRVCRVCMVVDQGLSAYSCGGRRLCAHSGLTSQRLVWASALLAPCRRWLNRGPCRRWLHRGFCRRWLDGGPCRPWLNLGLCATRRSRDALSPCKWQLRSPAQAL